MRQYDQELYRNVGSVINLLSSSQYHARFELRNYIEIEIAPSFRSEQIKIFYIEHRPVGFVSWARISKEILDELTSTSRSLRPDEWQCGTIPLINDIVADTMHLNYIVNILRREIFWSDSLVYAFRRFGDGTIRKVCRFRNFSEGRPN